MFLMAQLPFADLRGLSADGFGRLTKPDWRAVEHPEAFIRGFGKMAPRNGTGYGLYGERAFVDFNNAARFTGKISYNQSDWVFPLKIHPWFRRLYFDGFIAGRFEFGFEISTTQEVAIFEYKDGSPIDIPALLSVISETILKVYSPGYYEEIALGRCGKPLGLSYIAATTDQNLIRLHPPAETYGQYFSVGAVTFYMRFAPPAKVLRCNDERAVKNLKGHEIFIKSLSNASRNNIIVQSNHDFEEETGAERAVRLLFSHFNSLIYSGYILAKLEPDRFAEAKKEIMEKTVKNMLSRLDELRFDTSSGRNDEEFINAMQAFRNSYSGKAEELSDQIKAIAEKLNEPSLLQKTASLAKHTIKDMISDATATYFGTLLRQIGL